MSSSSAPARPVSPSATTSPAAAPTSCCSTPARRSGTPGAPAGTRCGCSAPRSTTRCPACRSRRRPTPTRRKDDVADYLAAYAAHFDLPVRLNSPGAAAAPRGRRRPSPSPRRPACCTPSRSSSPPARSRPRASPRSPSSSTRWCRSCTAPSTATPTQLPAGGRVLVVGAANSGLQIAAELAGTLRGHRRRRLDARRQLPQRIAGRDLFFWLTKSGFFTVPADSRIARRLRARGDLVIGTRSRDLRRARHRLPAAADRLHRPHRDLRRRQHAEVDAVVWATGYRPTTRGCTCPASSSTAQVRHTAGVTDVPGAVLPRPALADRPGLGAARASSAPTPPPWPRAWPPTPPTPFPGRDRCRRWLRELCPLSSAPRRSARCRERVRVARGACPGRSRGLRDHPRGAAGRPARVADRVDDDGRRGDGRRRWPRWVSGPR